MLKVYAMDVSGLDYTDVRLLSRMSPKRIEKINRLKSEKLKKQSIGAELLLNYALKREMADIELPIIWETDRNGKLFVPDIPFYVNLSHSEDYAVCAVSDREVGVDIQKHKETSESLAARFFTVDEYMYIKSAPDFSSAFYDIWTRKESLIKAAGKGLAIPLSGFSALKNTVVLDGKAYSFRKYKIKDSAYSLCACQSL